MPDPTDSLEWMGSVFLEQTGSVCLDSACEMAFLLVKLDYKQSSFYFYFQGRRLAVSFLSIWNFSLMLIYANLGLPSPSPSPSPSSSIPVASMCMSLRYSNLLRCRTRISRSLDQMVYLRPSSSLISKMSTFLSDQIFILLSLPLVIISRLTGSQSKAKISPSWSIASRFCVMASSAGAVILATSKMPLRKTRASLSSKLQQNLREWSQKIVRKQCALSLSRAVNRRQSSEQCETRILTPSRWTNCKLVILSRWQVSLARIRSMLSSDRMTILPLLQPMVISLNCALVCASGCGVDVLRALRLFSVISESNSMSLTGKKATKVGVWLREWFSESCVCWREKDSSILLLPPSILTLNNSPFSTSMQQTSGSYGQESTCLIDCAFSGGQKYPMSILFRSFFRRSEATICSPTFDYSVTWKAAAPVGVANLSKKEMLLSISLMNYMVLPKVSSPNSPFWMAKARRWSTRNSSEYSPSKLQTRSSSKVSSDQRQMVRSLAALRMTRSSLEGAIFSTNLVWQLQLWIMMHSAEETGESGSRQTLTLPLMRPVIVYLQLLLRWTQVMAASFFTSLVTEERNSNLFSEQKLMFCVDHTQSKFSPKSYPYPLFHDNRFFSSTARNSFRSMPNFTLDRNLVSLRLVLRLAFKASISITPTSRNMPSDSMYSKPTEYLLSQSDSRAIRSRFLLQTYSFQSLQRTISTPNDATQAQFIIPRDYHAIERPSRCSRCPSKATSGTRLWMVGRRTESGLKVGSTDSSPFIVTVKQNREWLGAAIQNQEVRVSEAGRPQTMDPARECEAEVFLPLGEGSIIVWYS